MNIENHEVVIAGGGPTGLMLAAELKLAGTDVIVVERQPDQHIDESRAKGIHSRAVEILDQRGIAERFVSKGIKYPTIGFGGIRLDISDFPTRHNYLLGLSQSKIQPILADWAKELGVTVLYDREITNFTQDDSGVTVEITGDQFLRAKYLVGCDGGRSMVRKVAGIDFPGLDASISYIIAEVKMDREPTFGIHPHGGGISRSPDGKSVGVVVAEKEVKHGDKPSIDDLREALHFAYETDFGLKSINWTSRFSDTTRQAATYRVKRILLAGDAAHIHPPQGGQGLGIGLQDAVNLGWKLGQVVKGLSSEDLLDTYHNERHPVGARVLQNTRAQIILSKSDTQHVALRDIVSELLSMDEPRKYIAGMLSGLDIKYDFGEGHPLLGRRVPDLDIRTAEGMIRIFSLLHDAKAVLLNFDKTDQFDVSAWSQRVTLVDAQYDGPLELPLIGAVETPHAMLVRPDGYVAWTGRVNDPDLPKILTTWFGK